MTRHARCWPGALRRGGTAVATISSRMRRRTAERAGHVLEAVVLGAGGAGARVPGGPARPAGVTYTVVTPEPKAPAAGRTRWPARRWPRSRTPVPPPRRPPPAGPAGSAHDALIIPLS